MVSHTPAKFGSLNKHRDSVDIILLACHMI